MDLSFLNGTVSFVCKTDCAKRHDELSNKTEIFIFKLCRCQSAIRNEIYHKIIDFVILTEKPSHFTE